MNVINRKFPVLSVTCLMSILLIFNLTSCKKEVQNPTEAEVISNEIQNVINNNHIKRLIVWDYNQQFPNSFPVNTGTDFRFSNGFLYVNGFFYDAFNLSKVRSYNISAVNIRDDSGNITGNEKALILYLE